MIDYLPTARNLAAKALIEYLESNTEYSVPKLFGADMYIVWFSKTLQNWKALVSTDKVNHFYVEVTHNGDKKETYCDVYEKKLNIAYKD